MPNKTPIISLATQRFKSAQAIKTTDLPPHSLLWGEVAKMHHDFILSCETEEQAITFAQKSNYYDHRIKKHRPSFIYQYFENVIYNMHPSKRDELPAYAETPVSSLGSVKLHNPMYKNTRLVSTSLYIHTSFILSCLEYKKNITRVCELGGGYGDIARLWMTTPSTPANFHMIVDLPESLFFAEVFLQIVLPKVKLFYLTSEKDADAAAAEKGPVIVLCPVQLRHLSKRFEIDIVINTLSLGEMTQEWVNFWSVWLNEQKADTFYSSNAFGMELDRMFECESWLSPTVTDNWIMTKYSLDHPYQVFWAEYTRRYAEIFFERTKDGKARTQTLKTFSDMRENTKFTINDILYCVYNLGNTVDVALEVKLVNKFLSDMTYIPKELYFWSKRILDSAEFKKTSPEIQKSMNAAFAKQDKLFKDQEPNVLFSNEKTISENLN